MVGRAALERLAIDRALEGEPEPVAGLDDAVLALLLIAALLREHALHLGIHVLLVDLDDRAVDLHALEFHQRDRRQHLVADLEIEVGVAVEHLVDHVLVVRQVDLGLRRGALGALVEGLGYGAVDGVRQHFRHRRAAIDLLEVRHRHLARAETLDVRRALHLVEPGIQPIAEVLGRDDHGEFALEALIEGFCDLHWGIPLSQQYRLAEVSRELVRVRGLEPPRLAALEPKSSASTSSATPARRPSWPGSRAYMARMGEGQRGMGATPARSRRWRRSGPALHRADNLAVSLRSRARRAPANPSA